MIDKKTRNWKAGGGPCGEGSAFGPNDKGKQKGGLKKQGRKRLALGYTE